MLNQFIVPKEKFLLGMYLGYMKCILKKWDRAVCPRGGLVVGTPPRVGVSDNPLPCRLALRPTLVPLRWGSVTPLRWFPCCGVPSPGLGCLTSAFVPFRFVHQHWAAHVGEGCPTLTLMPCCRHGVLCTGVRLPYLGIRVGVRAPMLGCPISAFAWGFVHRCWAVLPQCLSPFVILGFRRSVLSCHASLWGPRGVCCIGVGKMNGQ